jgi:hypothetical protein
MPDVPSGTAAASSRPTTEARVDRISLPKPLTSFIGRESELAQAKRLLQGSYLVTLTGPGGSGKTRLSIAVAAAVVDDFPDGVYFVPLAPVRDPGLVPSTIAQSIGLQDARDRPLMDHLVSQLRERRLLIVLDNFEHLLAGAPVVTRLLQETSAVRILVSSRSSLRVSGEQECPVPPLAVPDESAYPAAAELTAYDSVRLFTERAAAAGAGIRPGRRECPGDRGDRPQAGRPAAGHRAGGGARQGAAARRDPAPAGPFAGPADRRRPRPAGPAADASRHGRLEL